jgi:transcriptional regulator with XRE-family HTH domain
MGKAGKALKQTLESYKISQNKLAVTMGVPRSTVHKWVHEERDPTAETVTEIVRALKKLDAEAAETFVQRYLGDITSSYESD